MFERVADPIYSHISPTEFEAATHAVQSLGWSELDAVYPEAVQGVRAQLGSTGGREASRHSSRARAQRASGHGEG